MKGIKINIFLSYCHEDNRASEVDHFNEKLFHTAKQLTAFDFSLFQDTHSLRLGEKFDIAIQKAINNSLIFIAILSPSYFKSEYCMRELRLYLKLLKSKTIHGYIFPIYFTNIKEPLIKSQNYNNRTQKLYDEIMSYQFNDWRGIRKSSFNSIKYQNAIEKIANEIGDNIIEYSIATEKKIVTKDSPRQIILKYLEQFLPSEEQPKILVCGKTGNGKTTTINTLFGRRVGKIGYYTVGTKVSKEHHWKYEDERICLIDLPGLGVSKKEDEEYIKSYIPWLTKTKGRFPIHAILVVAAYPRLGEGTWDTVQLILDKGFPSECIIFGLNKLRELAYPIKKNSINNLNIELDDEYGLNEHDKKIVEKTKRAFVIELNKKFPNAKFKLNQCIEYDSRGWNIYHLLSVIVSVMPYTTLSYLMTTTKDARNKIIEQAKTIKKKEELIEENKRLENTVATKISEGISKSLNFISPTLGEMFDVVKPEFNRKLGNVINTGKDFYKAIKSFFWKKK